MPIQPVQRLPAEFVAQPFLDNLPYEADDNIAYTVGIVVEWPTTVRYGGRTYYRTGKQGVNVTEKPNVPCAEYQDVQAGHDSRVWLLLTGELEED